MSWCARSLYIGQKKEEKVEFLLALKFYFDKRCGSIGFVKNGLFEGFIVKELESE